MDDVEIIEKFYMQKYEEYRLEFHILKNRFQSKMNSQNDLDTAIGEEYSDQMQRSIIETQNDLPQYQRTTSHKGLLKNDTFMVISDDEELSQARKQKSMNISKTATNEN